MSIDPSSGLTEFELHGGKDLNEAGIDKSYKAIMDLEKHIQKLEQTFKREKSGMTRDRASKMEKSIYNLKTCWNRLYTDTQSR